MRLCVCDYIRKVADITEVSYWCKKMKEDYGIEVILQRGVTEESQILRQCFVILSRMPKKLLKDCDVNILEIRADMGKSKHYYPNHGFYINHKVALNFDMFLHPDRLEDPDNPDGFPVTRSAYTLVHEFGHAFDDKHGFPSKKPLWLSLSGWTPVFVSLPNGCSIKDNDWFYHPDAKFCRFYSKYSPEDDFCDCFSFFINGLSDLIPSDKRNYISRILAKYYDSSAIY